MRGKNDIAFVIPVYYPDKRKFTKLLNVIKTHHVFCVQNGGKYFTRKGSGKVHVLFPEINLGFAPGVNLGFKEALKTKATWIGVINDDLEMTKNALSQIELYASKCDVGLFGPIAGWFDEGRWSTILPTKGIDSPQRPIQYISGSALFIHRSVFESIGLLYEPYFMYYEDADYSARAIAKGFAIIHTPVKGLSHEESVGLGKNSYQHQFYLARNHLLFVERNAPWRVKLHELLRIPKTVDEHSSLHEHGANVGIEDYFLRRFGRFRRHI